jgi:hypothetical protein
MVTFWVLYCFTNTSGFYLDFCLEFPWQDRSPAHSADAAEFNGRIIHLLDQLLILNVGGVFSRININNKLLANRSHFEILRANEICGYDSKSTDFQTQRIRDIVSVKRVFSQLLPSVTMINCRSPLQNLLARQPPEVGVMPVLMPS